MDQSTRIRIAKSLMAAAKKLDTAKAFDPDAVKVANDTSRSRGAVGENAIVPRIVRELAGENDRILDFGAGKLASHTARLRGEGFDVTAYDFGENVDTELHDPKALEKGSYDMVYASNVLNVQSSIPMMKLTLRQIRGALSPGGVFIGNFPLSPRKMIPKGTPPEVVKSAEFQAKLTADAADAIESVFGSKPMVVNLGRAPKEVKKYPVIPVFYVKKS